MASEVLPTYFCLAGAASLTSGSMLSVRSYPVTFRAPVAFMITL